MLSDLSPILWGFRIVSRMLLASGDSRAKSYLDARNPPGRLYDTTGYVPQILRAGLLLRASRAAIDDEALHHWLPQNELDEFFHEGRNQADDKQRRR